MKIRNKKISKKTLLIIVISLILVITLATPTLSRFVSLGFVPSNLPVWDGSVASSYESGDGSKENPYIISSGAQFAYFAKELENQNYENTYFKLGNDIILNDGFFTTDAENINYIYNENTYYINKYTAELYTNSTLEEKASESINLFSSINKFAGNLDGSFHSIYGLYLTDKDSKELALFNNLTGKVENLFIENTMVVGNEITSGLANNASGAEISNVYIHGNVVSSNEISETTETIELKNINFTSYSDNKELYMFEEIDLGKEIISSKLSGDYVVSEEEELNYELSINNEIIELGKFEIDLGKINLNDLKISISKDDNIRDISLINLKYEVVYKTSYSSALVNNAEDIVINNVVTDVSVYNQINSSGFINVAKGNIDISNSYNTGIITSNINNEAFINATSKAVVNLDKVYNSNELDNNSDIIGINNEDSEISISNSFNTNGKIIGDDYSKESILENTYSYIEEKSVEKLVDPYTKEFFDILVFGDYNKEKTTEEDVWIYNDTILPELFYMNEINLLDVRIGNDSWNKLHSATDNKYYNNDITIAVTSSAYVYTLDTVEYFVKTSSDAFTLEDMEFIEWTPYEKAISLTEQGEYIVYIKVTNYDGKVKYLNTDVLIIDKVNPDIELEFDGTVWTSYRKDVSEVYMEDNELFSITATDNESGLQEVSYYLSNEIQSEEELSKLNDANWTEYQNEFNIIPVGNNILYARAVDYSGNISYSNSDIITFDGYYMNYIEAGRNDLFTTSGIFNITSNSSVTANYLYNIPSQVVPDSKHYVSFNKFVPQGTIIVITDNITGQKYDYQVPENNIRDIPFESFNLVGTVNSFYTERSYDNGTNIVENYTITMNFEEAIITETILYFGVWIELWDLENNVIRETTASSVSTFNIHYRSDADVFFESTTTSIYLKHNTDSIYGIDINTGVNYQKNSSKDIIDTFIEEQDLVMKFKLYDEYDQSVPRNKLNNIMLKLYDVEYYPNEHGEFIISLERGISQIDSTLEIYAYKGDAFLDEGRYSLEMTSYISYNEHPSNYIDTKYIPLTVTHTAESSNMSFKAEMLNDGVLKKEDGLANINITSVLSGIENPNVRISLYKKDVKNALDQTYSLVNLNDYTTNNLTTTNIENKYLIDNNNFNFELDLSLLDKNAYKFVIESYSEDELISSIEKSFVVK